MDRAGVPCVGSQVPRNAAGPTGVRPTMAPRRAPRALVLAAVLAALPAAARADGDRVVAVHIVSRIGDDGVPDDRPKRARAADGVTLFAVVIAEERGARRVYADAPAVRIGGKTLAARPLADGPAVALAWSRVEPSVATMSNTASGAFRFETIPYAETAIDAWRGRAVVAADVRPTLTPDHGRGVGTMRYRLVARTADGAVVATPGVDARRGRGSGGLSDAVHRVALRRDDSFLGLLTELFGQPYIWASAGTSDARHQSERLEGSDCADFIVYARRRQGSRMAYTWTGDLPRHTRLLGRGTAGADGVYRDADGAPLRFPQAGDLVLFPRHVGALAEDRGVPGVLDHADVMMHSYFDTPREQPIGESDYAGTWLEVRRFRGKPGAAAN